MDSTSNVDDLLRSLMEAAQAGDSDAYAALLQAVTPIVRRAVRGRSRATSPEDVEDIVQEVLLSLHQARATYTPGRPFLPWLMALVRHRAIDAARRRIRRAGREVVVEDLDVTFAAPAANSEYVDPTTMAQLTRAVQALPGAQRQAVEMLKLRDMSLKEASAATGVSIGALKVATHRAMASLRQALRRRESR